MLESSFLSQSFCGFQETGFELKTFIKLSLRASLFVYPRNCALENRECQEMFYLSLNTEQSRHILFSLSGSHLPSNTNFRTIRWVGGWSQKDKGVQKVQFLQEYNRCSISEIDSLIAANLNR